MTSLRSKGKILSNRFYFCKSHHLNCAFYHFVLFLDSSAVNSTIFVATLAKIKCMTKCTFSYFPFPWRNSQMPYPRILSFGYEALEKIEF